MNQSLDFVELDMLNFAAVRLEMERWVEMDEKWRKCRRGFGLSILSSSVLRATRWVVSLWVIR